MGDLRSDGRGQKPLDFQVGAAVFLFTVIFVIAFTPTTLDTFDDGGQSDTITADRIASDLALDDLGHPREPYRLDRNETARFFENGEYEDVDDELGATQSINVSITRVDGSGDRVLACWDDSTNEVTTGCTGGSDVTFAGGGNASLQRSVVTSSRTVTIGGKKSRLSVRVW